MIRTLLLIFVCLQPYILFSQSYKSEIVDAVRYFEIAKNKLTQIDSVTIQVNDKGADTRIVIPYAKGDKLSVDFGYIEDRNGKIVRRLSQYDITAQSYVSEASLYEDDFVKWFDLKHDSYPYRLVYSYRIEYPKFCQITDMDMTGSEQMVHKRKVVVTLPSEEEIRYKYKNIQAPEIEEVKNKRRYIWQFSYSPQKEELNMSYNTSLAPQLQILPLNFRYGVEGSSESWETFGNWLYRLNEGRDIVPKEEQARIDKQLEGISESKDKVRALYRYMQENTRYINVSLNVGGLQTYPAEYVCKYRYGDCKALVNYLQAMLKYAGVESYYTVVDMDSRVRDIDPDFAAQQFNHVILTIPFANDTIYQECTSKNLPFGYIHSEIQGRKALLIKEQGSVLVDIPQMAENEKALVRSFTINVDEDKHARIKMSSTLRGHQFERMDGLLAAMNKSEIERYLKENLFVGTYDLLDSDCKKPDENVPLITLDVNCKLNNIYKKYGQNIVLNGFPAKVDIYEAPETRTSDVQIDYPLSWHDRFEYIFDGMTLSKVPDDIFVESAYGSYEVKFAIDGNKLLVNKVLIINKGRYPVAEYASFYRFMSIVRSLENKNYYIETL